MARQVAGGRRAADSAKEAATDGARLVHETLLPFLNSRPLMASIDPAKADWEPQPPGGAVAGPSHAVLEATRHVLRGCGMNSALAGQLVVMLRWTLLRMAEADLRSERSKRLAAVVPPRSCALRGKRLWTLVPRRGRHLNGA